MATIDSKIEDIRWKIEEVKKRWPAHSPKPAMFSELENLELELEKLLAKKKTQSD